VVITFANLSLIFVDYLKVPKELFGYYQTVIMGAYFVGSMGGAYLIKKWGLLSTKYAGTIIFISGIFSLTLLTYLEGRSPVLLIISMAMASLGSALSGPIFFSYSMSYLKESLRGSAMSLSQCLRLFITFGLVWFAAKWFDGSTKPMSILALTCLFSCSLFYLFLYRKKWHAECV
jgi:DHA1 family bicyclomycin/chloramphenicol resistance-like MFS transporter